MRIVRARRCLSVLVILVAGGCGAEADLGGSEQPVGGRVAGLTPGETITLQDNLGDNLTISSNGAFAFPTALASGGRYAVTILSEPSSPIAQTCSVSGAIGTVEDSPIKNVAVSCDLLAYFPFSGNADDASGYGNNAVVAAATLAPDRNGAPDSAYAFAGTGEIEAAMPAGFLPSGDAARTLTAWLMPTQSTNMDGIVYWGSGSCTGSTFGLGDYNNQANFWGGCDDYVSGIVIPTNAWTFVAITYTPNILTQVTFYVGSESVTGTVDALVTASTGNLVIGADLATGVSFTGSLDSIRVYAHALNAAEVQSIFSSSAP